MRFHPGPTGALGLQKLKRLLFKYRAWFPIRAAGAVVAVGAAITRPPFLGARPGSTKIAAGALPHLHLGWLNRQWPVLDCRARPPGRAAICGPASVRPLRKHKNAVGAAPCGRPPGLADGMGDVYRVALLKEAAQSSTSPVRSPSDTPVIRTFTNAPAGTVPAAVKYTCPSISTESA